jgi:protein-tyrosine phosphatase
VHVERWVPLEGSANFRDLAGWRTPDGRRVRVGRVFRSDALHQLSAPDVERLRDGLGLRTLLDLRSSHEVTSEGRGPLALPPVRYHHLPFFDGPPRDRAQRPAGGLGEIYFQMLRFAREPIVRAVETLAASEGAAVFQCAAGKDRTGILAAVVLGSLGVLDEDIVEDYAATRRALPRILERLRASDAYQYVFTELPPETLHAEPETMRDLLARVRGEWGTLADYLRWAGAGEDSLEALRDRLLG